MAHVSISLQTLQFQQAARRRGSTRTFAARATRDIYGSLPLPQDEKATRILQMEPANDFDEPISGTLQVIYLDDSNCPPFRALSYTWAPEYPKDTICCGGHRLEVTANCSKALRQIRQVFGQTAIWVDSICIDQGNDTEKQSQIPLMADIYLKAFKTIVWLGEAENSSGRVIQIIKDAAKTNYLPAKPQLNLPTWLQKGVFTLTLLPPYTTFSVIRHACTTFSVNRTDYDHITKFLERPWFARAWTFQECILPPDIVILCGTQTLDWDVFLRGAEYLNDDGKTVPSVRKRLAELPFLGKLLFYKILSMWGPVKQLSALSRTNPVDVLELPWAFQTCRRTFHLWMNIQRNGGESFSDRQIAYTKIHDALIPRGWKGRLIAAWFVFSPLPFLLLVAASIEARTENKSNRVTIGGVFLVLGSFCFSSILALGPGFLCITSLPKRRTLGSGNQRDIDIESVVLFLRHRTATKGSDLFNAIHGLLRSMGIPRLSDPDFGMNLGDTYRHLFCDLVRWEPGFIILLLDAGDDPELDGYEMYGTPSWVPDWSKLPENSTKSMDWYFFFNIREHQKLNATPGVCPRAGFSSSSTQLNVLGIIPGRISFIINKFEALDEDHISRAGVDTAAHYLFPAVSKLVNWIEDISNRGGERRNDIRKRTYLILTESYCDLRDLEKPAQSSSPLANLKKRLGKFDPLYQILCEVHTSNSSYQRGKKERIRAAAKKITKDKDLRNLLIEIVNFLARDRFRLFVMRDGTFGRAIKGSATGDRLALIAGVPAPLVLRPRSPGRRDWYDSKYEVVGAAFVQRWTDGSAFDRDIVENTWIHLV